MAGALPFAAGDSNPSFPVAAAMSSPAARPYAGAPSPQPIFPDEILGEIFLRLDSAADLARASAARTAFIRVVRFLRRNRSLYRRTVISFLPSEARSSATLARSTTPSRRTGPLRHLYYHCGAALPSLPARRAAPTAPPAVCRGRADLGATGG
jgi:hypothetical protein